MNRYLLWEGMYDHKTYYMGCPALVDRDDLFAEIGHAVDGASQISVRDAADFLIFEAIAPGQHLRIGLPAYATLSWFGAVHEASVLP